MLIWSSLLEIHTPPLPQGGGETVLGTGLRTDASISETPPLRRRGVAGVRETFPETYLARYYVPGVRYLVPAAVSIADERR
jgi:hypothetical protein